jgi:hypothetical protein
VNATADWIYLSIKIAAPLALVAAVALRWLYLRAVRRSMLRPVPSPAAWSDDDPPLPTHPASADPPSRRLEIAPAPRPTRAAVRAAGRGPWVVLTIHSVAGLAYASAMTAAWVWMAIDLLGGIGWHAWKQMLWFCLFYVWPVVILVSLLVKLSWRTMAVVVVLCAALFIGVTWLALGGLSATVPPDVDLPGGLIAPARVSLLQVVDTWWTMNGVATLLVLAFLVRPIRAIGPIMVALMTTAVAGVIGTVLLLTRGHSADWFASLATDLGFTGTVGAVTAVLLVLGVAAVTAGSIGYLALCGFGRLYRTQRISEQSIQVYAVWLVFALAHTPPAMPYAGVAAFGVYVLVARLGLRLFVNRDRGEGTPTRLLLLRVFSLGRRSESLFNAFSRSWRYTGSIHLIAGPDLANATIEPHEFLDFLAGRLQRRFITGPATLHQRITEISLRPDPDGRFRVFDFFCHADTWQQVLRRLVRRSDAVMMDLRGFTSSNEGCVFELHELLDTVPLDRIMLVVDSTTDESFLADILQQGWVRVSGDSQNRTDAHPQVRVFRLDRGWLQQTDELVATLAGVNDRSMT